MITSVEKDHEESDRIMAAMASTKIVMHEAPEKRGIFDHPLAVSFLAGLAVLLTIFALSVRHDSHPIEIPYHETLKESRK